MKARKAAGRWRRQCPEKLLYGLSSWKSEAFENDVYGANADHDPHDDVQDRGQNNFPGDRFAGHGALVPFVAEI